MVISPTEEPGAAEQYLNMCDQLLFRVYTKLLSTIIWLDALINGVASWETLWAVDLPRGSQVLLICLGEARCLFCIRDERGQSEQQRVWDRAINMKWKTPYYCIQTGTHVHMWGCLTRAIRRKFKGDRKKWTKGQWMTEWNSERQELWCNNINIITQVLYLACGETLTIAKTTTDLMYFIHVSLFVLIFHVK